MIWLINEVDVGNNAVQWWEVEAQCVGPARRHTWNVNYSSLLPPHISPDVKIAIKVSEHRDKTALTFNCLVKPESKMVSLVPHVLPRYLLKIKSKLGGESFTEQ